MMTHPDHVAILAAAHRRELTEQADEFRLARLAGPLTDCRTPTAVPPSTCRPDVRHVRRLGRPSALLRRRRSRSSH